MDKMDKQIMALMRTVTQVGLSTVSLGAGHDTPGKVLFQYLDGVPKFVSILKKKDFNNILNN